MNWQQILPVVAVLGVGFVFVWRGSSPKKHKHTHGCGCGCEPGHDAPAEEKSPADRS